MEDNTRQRVIYFFKLFQPEIGKFLGFDHITLYVGNALQSSSFYVSRMGFSPYAYQVEIIFFLFTQKNRKNTNFNYIILFFKSKSNY